MLELFRNQTKNPFIWVILGIIIVAFVLTFNTSGPITAQGGVEVSSLIDVQGAATIRKKAPGGVFIFLEAPNLQELSDRLTARMTESSEALKRRIETAAQEMDQAPSFDYRVVNRSGRLGEAVAEVEQIISAERARPHGDIFAEGS